MRTHVATVIATTDGSASTPVELIARFNDQAESAAAAPARRRIAALR
jgi:hypothetical protein